VFVVKFSTGAGLPDAAQVVVTMMKRVIGLRDLRGMSLREAIDVVVEARTTRQQAEVQEGVAILHIVETYIVTCPRTRCRAGAGWWSWRPRVVRG
jgi:hypothetical protein